MRGLARISLDGGGTLVMDADTPYEWELLFDHLDRYANLHGNVSVQLNRHGWSVRISTSQPPNCNACGHPPRALIYALGRRVFCPRCARAYCLTNSTQVRPRKLPQRKEGVWREQPVVRPESSVRAAKRKGG